MEILNKEIVLEFIQEQRNEMPHGETLSEKDNIIGQLEMLVKLLDLTENHI